MPCLRTARPGERLEAHPVGEVRRDLGVVVGRRDLDHVDARDGQLAADPADGVQQLPRGQPAGLGGAGAGGVARVADVDVDREEDRVAVVEGDLEGLVEARLQAALADLGHLVGPHVLLGHPPERLRAGPVAAQPHLQEPVAAQGAGLDQPPHRLAVAVERAELDVAGVGVGVEVDHRDPAVARGAARRRWRPAARSSGRRRARAGRRRPTPRRTRRPPAPPARARSRRAASRRRRRRRRGCPGARRRAAPGAGASRPAAGSRSAGWPSGRTGCPGGCEVPPSNGAPTIDHVGRGQRVGVVEVDAVHAEEGDVGTELGAVPGHGGVPTRRGAESAAHASDFVSKRPQTPRIRLPESRSATA